MRNEIIVAPFQWIDNGVLPLSVFSIQIIRFQFIDLLSNISCLNEIVRNLESILIIKYFILSCNYDL